MHSIASSTSCALGDSRAARARNRRLRVAVALNCPCAARPLVEERRHVGDEVLHDRQVVQRPDLEPVVSATTRDVRAARPARLAVDRHRARAAHADAAREAVRERRVELALDVGDDVQHRLALEPGHLELPNAVLAPRQTRTLSVGTQARGVRREAVLRREHRSLHLRCSSSRLTCQSSRTLHTPPASRLYALS